MASHACMQIPDCCFSVYGRIPDSRNGVSQTEVQQDDVLASKWHLICTLPAIGSTMQQHENVLVCLFSDSDGISLTDKN